MIKRFVVKKYEQAALLKDGDFVRILNAGRHYFWDPMNRLSVQVWRIDTALTDVELGDYLRAREPRLVEACFEIMDQSEDEIGLRYENEVLVEILPPGTRRMIWKGVLAHRLEKIDLRQTVALPAALTMRLTQPGLRGRPVAGLTAVLLAQIPAYHVGIVRIDGRIERMLNPGIEAYWRFNREIAVELVDTRLQNLEVSGQEILTRDKVGLRINLGVTWRYADVLLACEKLAKPVDHLYRELQFGLRAAVGTRSLDELLENKRVIDEAVSEYAVARLAGFGIEIRSLGVKDIVLPGEMRTILAQVVEAEKAAQANVIRRREETSATRSLLNTARVMEENPIALRLKELETLERVAERIDRISVFGGLDQVLNGLVTLKGNH